MSVIPFRKPSPVAVSKKPAEPRSIAELVNTTAPGSLTDLDLTGLMRIEGPKAEDGSVQVTYSAELENKVRRLVEKVGMPRMPFTAAELDALMGYVAYLEGARADDLEHNESWQRRWLALSEEHFPGYAPGLRLFIAENLEGLKEHHATKCGYPELIEYDEKYYGRE
ncbi:MAG: hypothetical protein ACD_23C00220G0001 [uncultured bacterium]|jgi:hypothetical protein|nr:MAG: hypothetical protein ACD_23C00220G0001 [uncultured bacterium]